MNKMKVRCKNHPSLPAQFVNLHYRKQPLFQCQSCAKYHNHLLKVDQLRQHLEQLNTFSFQNFQSLANLRNGMVQILNKYKNSLHDSVDMQFKKLTDFIQKYPYFMRFNGTEQENQAFCLLESQFITEYHEQRLRSLITNIIPDIQKKPSQKWHDFISSLREQITKIEEIHKQKFTKLQDQYAPMMNGLINNFKSSRSIFKEIYRHTDCPKEKLRLCQQFLSCHQDDEVKKYKAESLYKLARYDQSITIYNQLLQKGIDKRLQFKIYFGLGNCWKKMKNYFKAKQCYVLALQIKENDECLLNKAQCLIQLTMLREAKNELQKLMQNQSSNSIKALALFNLGTIHKLNKENEQAQKCFEECKKLNPNIVFEDQQPRCTIF